MVDFHDSVIRPLLALLQPRRILEIGLGKGAHTERLLEYATDHDATVNAIDTLIPAELTRLRNTFGSKLEFLQGTSLNVLHTCPPADIVFIDGDHNWYTVFHELVAIEEIAQKMARWPVVILHDTGWPYARRDLYYDPLTIPATFRHPFVQGGVLPGVSKPVAGGFNPTYMHAQMEGGPRNGVLTAVEDFLAQSTQHYQVFHVAGLHGLTIISPSALLKANIPLSRFLDELKASPALSTHLATLETKRIELMIAGATYSDHPVTAGENADMRRQIDHLQQERMHLLNEIDRLIHSSSWKITLPLRLMRRCILACRPRVLADAIRRDFSVPVEPLVPATNHSPIADTATGEGANIQTQITYLQEERMRLLSEVDRLLHSSSWKLTLPLRLMRRCILACRPRSIKRLLLRDFSILLGRRPVIFPQSPRTAPVTVLLCLSEKIGDAEKTLASLRRQSVRPQRIVLFGNEAQERDMQILLATDSTAEWGAVASAGWMERFLPRDSRPFVLPLQSGTVLHPDYIRHALDALHTFPSAGFAYSDAYVSFSHTTIRTHPSPSLPQFFHPSCLARREALVQACAQGFTTGPALWQSMLDTGWGAIKSRGNLFFRTDPRVPLPPNEPRDATLFVALSGRSWMWPITSAFLERQLYPHDRMHLVLLDTSQNPTFSSLVLEWMKGSDYASVSYTQLSAGSRGLADQPRESVAQEMSDACALIYNTFARQCRTPLACILEDDVVPPDDAYVQLASTLWNTTALSVAGVYRHRLSPRIIAWNWSLEGQAVDVHMKNGVGEIGGTGFGCIAIRGDRFRQAIFHGGDPLHNYDQNFFRECVFERGETALIDWDCRCKHYVHAHHWVVPL